MTQYPGVANTIDSAIQRHHDARRTRLGGDAQAARAHRRGFNSGLAGEPTDPIGIGASHIGDFDAGVQAGLELRRTYTGGIPTRLLPNGRFGLPKPNPAFRHVSNELYLKVTR